jgi:DNA-binding transcriptional regulator YiaG
MRSDMANAYTEVQTLRTIPDTERSWTNAMINTPEEHLANPYWGWNVVLPENRHASLSVMTSIAPEEELDVTSLSPSEQIKFIRETLRLNMSQIARLLGITRPTAYAWLDGRESDRGETAGKIMRLAVEVKKIKGMNIPRIDLLVKRFIFNGKSLLDLLKECKNIENEIDALKKIGDREEKTRRSSKYSQAKRNISHLSEAIDELSTPIFFEEFAD